MVNLGLMAPLFIQVDTEGNGSAPVLHLLHANLDRHNATPAKAVQYLNQQVVDLLFVQEVTPEWLSRLQTELTHYRLVRAEPKPNSHGSALFMPISVPIAATPQIAFLDTQIIHLPATSDRPLLETRIRWAEQEITILSLHVIRPRNQGTATYQQTEFAAVAAWSQSQHQHHRHVVVLGDFNSTPWSRPFRLLVHQSGLVNSQRGFGLQPTWRAGFPAMLMIPIDHCLHSTSMTTVKRTIGANIGSDHLPLLVDVVPKSAATFPKGTG
jgi:endonuclease/exonuclease/phosphatase (EEP) superfamily protein YafD